MLSEIFLLLKLLENMNNDKKTNSSWLKFEIN